MTRTTLYQGQGITAYQEDRYSTVFVSHDLDDADLAASRDAALAEIDGRIESAAPDAKRIDPLTSARAQIAALRTRAEVAAAKAAEKAESRREIAEGLSDLRKEYDRDGVSALVGSGGRIDWRLCAAKSYGGFVVADLLSAATEENARYAEAEAAETEAAQQRRERAAREREEQEDEEQRVWIGEHGSPRLQRLLAEGIDITRTYENERLAFDRAGWSWYSCTCGALKGVRDTSVTEAMLDALTEARLVTPDARLDWMGEGEHVSDCTCPTDEYDAREVAQRVVLVAEYHGDTIIREIKPA